MAILFYMMFGWFGEVIRDSEAGKFNKQVDSSYRWSMSWFIFSEVMFFAAFFGALFYTRVLSVPWLGEGDTMQQLWPNFKAVWPTAGPGLTGGPDGREIHPDGGLGHPGDQHPVAAVVRGHRDLGALGTEKEQSQPVDSRSGHDRDRWARPSLDCKPSSIIMPTPKWV